MIYGYICETCDCEFDVVKSVKDYNREEPCPRCKSTINHRVFTTQRPLVDKTAREYYPSLGCVIKNKHHRKEEIKKRNLVEVGNEKPATIHKEMEKQAEHNREKRWRDV